MGCVASKNAVSVTPAADSSGALRERSLPRAPEAAATVVSVTASSLRCSSAAAAGRRSEKKRDEAAVAAAGEEPSEKAVIAAATASRSFRLRSLRRSLEGEQVAAGWPPWLSAVAGEAIQGWIPLKADSFEKLEKVLGFNSNSSSVIFRCNSFNFFQACQFLDGGWLLSLLNFCGLVGILQESHTAAY
jgi:hypothetical protein